MKQTAIEWLIEKVNSKEWQDKFIWHKEEDFEQAKEMEKEAHQETWDVAHQAGRFEGKGIAEENWFTFEEYWEENFKQQEQ
jgi:hypothetical protein